MEFKDKLKEKRLEKKLTQRELADEIYVSRSLIAKWENGLGLPSNETLKLLSDYFGMESSDFIPTERVEKSFVQKNRTINKLKYYLLGVFSVALLIIIVLSVMLIIKSVKLDNTVSLSDAPKITINDKKFYKVCSFESNNISVVSSNNYNKDYYKNMVSIEYSELFEIESSKKILDIEGSYFYLDEDFNPKEKVSLTWFDPDAPKVDSNNLIIYGNSFAFNDVDENYSYICVNFTCTYSSCEVGYFCLIDIT